MSVTIEMDPEIENHLQSEAAQRGLNAAELALILVEGFLDSAPTSEGKNGSRAFRYSSEMTIFDSGALIAWLRFEPGALRVRRILRENPQACCIHAVNWCEIYYGFARAENATYAERVMEMITNVGIVKCDDLDEEFLKDGGDVKNQHRLSVADAFARPRASTL